MFPDFSKMGEGIDALNAKFDIIIDLLKTIAENTQPTPPDEDDAHA